MSVPAELNKRLEVYKIFFEMGKAKVDYLKQIITLSTGSIMILTILLEKLFKNPEWMFLIVLVLISFLLSIFFALAAQESIMGILYKGFLVDESLLEISEYQTELKLYEKLCHAGSLFFILGLIILSIFAIKNLY